MSDTHDATDTSDTASGDTLLPTRFVFYGRCATEDNQEPGSALNWQRAQAQALMDVAAPDAVIVADYFDAGGSKTVPWATRPEASRLLDDLSNPARGWDAIVVGEGKRCFYGAQFSDVVPTMVRHGVALYLPELAGRYDPQNAIHDTLMMMTVGLAKR